MRCRLKVFHVRSWLDVPSVDPSEDSWWSLDDLTLETPRSDSLDVKVVQGTIENTYESVVVRYLNRGLSHITRSF